jgi:hypothetical protein
MLEDVDPVETQEWRDALDSVLESDGADRAAFLLAELIEEARRSGRRSRTRRTRRGRSRPRSSCGAPRSPTFSVGCAYWARSRCRCQKLGSGR